MRNYLEAIVAISLLHLISSALIVLAWRSPTPIAFSLLLISVTGYALAIGLAVFTAKQAWRASK